MAGFFFIKVFFMLLIDKYVWNQVSDYNTKYDRMEVLKER